MFDDLVDMRSCDTELSRKRRSRRAGQEQESYVLDIFIGQFCPRVEFSDRWSDDKSDVVFATVPAFLPSVPLVVSVGPYEQMRRVTAGRIVAGVADDHAFMDRSCSQHVRHPVSAVGLSAPTCAARDGEFSVSVLVDTCRPGPAFVSL